MIFGPIDEPMPEVDISEQRLAQLLGDIKRNSRNRRIAMFAPLVLAAAVVGAMIAAPPQHGGLALTADAESPDPELPRVFGSNGVWRLAEPIEDGPVSDTGPASVIEVPIDPASPDFTLSPPDQDDLSSLPTSTSSPPTSTSGQSLDGAPNPPTTGIEVAPGDPVESDQPSFDVEIRIEPAVEPESEEVDAANVAADTDSTASTDAASAAPDASASVTADAADAGDAESSEQADSAETDAASEQADGPATAGSESTPDTAAAGDSADTDEEISSTPEDNQAPDDVTVAAEPQSETLDPVEANPSTPPAESADATMQAFSTPATIIPQSVIVYSAHVSVNVQVVDDDSSVIDWCNTRVDWGDGSVSRVAGADDAALCTASCEYEATSSAASNAATGDTATDTVAGIDQVMAFEHDYQQTIDASPRIFVATGDGCSYTLAELQLAPFTVVPLP